MSSQETLWNISLSESVILHGAQNIKMNSYQNLKPLCSIFFFFFYNMTFSDQASSERKLQEGSMTQGNIHDYLFHTLREGLRSSSRRPRSLLPLLRCAAHCASPWFIQMHYRRTGLWLSSMWPPSGEGV